MQKKGFTLLELIIVVLIIGILVSLALPQYTKIREKATAAEGINILGAVRSAQFRFYTEYGVYTNTLSRLDTTFPQGNNFTAPHPIVGTDSCLGEIYRSGSLYALYIGINSRVFCWPINGSCPSGITRYPIVGCYLPSEG